jgi:hypothetical protein
MARKKKKEEKEEEYEWVPPEFDEKAFLRKDMAGTKALILTVLAAVLFGTLAFLIGVSVNPAGGILALIVGAFSLKYIYKLFKIDPAIIDKKLYVGNIAIFLLLFLGVWILLLNEPFSS